MKEIKDLYFALENCEQIHIPKNAIGDLHIGGFRNIINRIACNSISKYTVADEFAIELYRDSSINYTTEGMFLFDEDITKKSEMDHIFDRLTNFKDITQIIVKFEDDSYEEYDVNYHEEDAETLGSDNRNEKVYVSELGNLYIVIEAGKTIEDYFKMDEINDKDYVDFLKDMRNIGIAEPEENILSAENLPDLYRYVYLSNDKQTVLAVRVEDEDSGWKFVYESPDKVIYPTKWQYLNSKIGAFVKKTNKGKKLDLEALKSKYKPASASSKILPS